MNQIKHDSLSARISRFEAVMFGLAIGDALGYAVEFSSLDAIRERYGPDGIQEPDLQRGPGGAKTAHFSDDTQMTLAVAQGMLRGSRLGLDTPEEIGPLVAEEFISWSQKPVGGHRAPGNACMAGCRALLGGAPWQTAGLTSAGGCGSVMRSAPYALFYLDDHDEAVRAAVLHSGMTHRHPIALGASAALVSAVWHALHGATMGQICEAAVEAASRQAPVTAAMIREDILYAERAARDPSMKATIAAGVLDQRRGWAAHEAISAALFCFRATGSYREAVVMGANSPGDSDSIACIAGAIAGAYYGIEGIPEAWRQTIERREVLAAFAAALAGVSFFKINVAA